MRAVPPFTISAAEVTAATFYSGVENYRTSLVNSIALFSGLATPDAFTALDASVAARIGRFDVPDATLVPRLQRARRRRSNRSRAPPLVAGEEDPWRVPASG
jgi:hypothetical protein